MQEEEREEKTCPLGHDEWQCVVKNIDDQHDMVNLRATCRTLRMLVDQVANRKMMVEIEKFKGPEDYDMATWTRLANVPKWANMHAVYHPTPVGVSDEVYGNITYMECDGEMPRNANLVLLKHIPNWKFLECDSLVDCSALARVQCVMLTCCMNVEDVSMLGGLKYLQLECCSKITSLKGLGTVEYLSLWGLPNLESLEGLGSGNREVCIEDCGWLEDHHLLDLPAHVPDVSPIGRVRGLVSVSQMDTRSTRLMIEAIGASRGDGPKEVTLRGPVNLFREHLTPLQHVQVLNLRRYEYVVGTFPLLASLTDLVLEHCVQVSGFIPENTPRSLKRVRLVGLNNLVDLRGLSRVESCEVVECEELEDVGPLEHVPRITLKCCRKVRDVSGLTNVEELDVRGSIVVSGVLGLRKLRKLKTSRYRDEALGLSELERRGVEVEVSSSMVVI